VAWPFKKRATATPFGRELLAVRQQWDERIEQTEAIEGPNRIVLLASSAGATVALGGFGSVLIQKLAGQVALYDGPDGEARMDPIIAFANRLDRRPNSLEAAYRAATWGLVAEIATTFWRPNYEIEMFECAKAFEFRNEQEGKIAALGEPTSMGASDEAEVTRTYDLMKGTLYEMVGAAIEESVEPDFLVTVYIQQWIDQVFEGLSVAKEVIEQHAPEGLPIWEDTE